MERETEREEEREREEGQSEERERGREHLSSEVVAGGQVLEAEQAIPLAGASSAGVIVHHLKNSASQGGSDISSTSCNSTNMISQPGNALR